MGLEDTNIEISTFLTYIIAYFEVLYTLIILHLLCVLSTKFDKFFTQSQWVLNGV